MYVKVTGDFSLNSGRQTTEIFFAETTCAFTSPFTKETRKTTLNCSPEADVSVFVMNFELEYGVNIVFLQLLP